MLTVGDTFPAFALKAAKAGPEGLKLDTAFTEISSDSNPGMWKLVFFWPKDFTFVCPTEIVAFGKLAGDFADRDTVVYGVSIDSEFVHLNWRLHHDDLRNLPIPMLADVKRELAAAAGVLDKNEGVALRATFLVDPDGIVRYAAVNDLSVGRNPAEVLRVLDALQTDELCPCNWNKGEAVLRPQPEPTHDIPAGLVPAGTSSKATPMSLDNLKTMLPDYAKDLRLNLGSLATEAALSAEQRAGTFVAAAVASRNPGVTAAIIEEFAAALSPEALSAAKAAAAIMAMNNIYYRFTHLVGGDYAKMPAKLRMNVMARPGVDRATFELWALAVSAINGCGMCMESHEQAVRQDGLTAEQVQAAVRIAAVVHAVASTLDSEQALVAPD